MIMARQRSRVLRGGQRQLPLPARRERPPPLL